MLGEGRDKAGSLLFFDEAYEEWLLRSVRGDSFNCRLKSLAAVPNSRRSLR